MEDTTGGTRHTGKNALVDNETRDSRGRTMLPLVY